MLLDFLFRRPTSSHGQRIGRGLILYRRKFLRIAEVWFENKGGQVVGDIVQYIGASQPIEGAHCDEFHTLVVTLQQGIESEMLDAMDKSTRYEIRRAKAKDNLNYLHSKPLRLEDMSEFLHAYERDVAQQDNAPKLDMIRVSALVRAGVFDVSVMRDQEGRALTWHVHVVGQNVARLFLSASAFSATSDQKLKNLCGRANRLHHWMDMQRYRILQFSQYDFGGYYAGLDDVKKLEINRFKRGFGGRVICTYNNLIPNTIVGHFALAIRHYMTRKNSHDT
jgi:hypothetical protein